MSRQAQNDQFLRTAFLDGANAAYIEQLQEEYEKNPGSVSDEWRHFFESMKSGHVSEEPSRAEHASWAVPLNQLAVNDELTSALTGDYAAVEQDIRNKISARAHFAGFDMSPVASLRATQDSIRALMLIRSYRVMGHLAADLDPLGLADRKVHRAEAGDLRFHRG